MLRWLLPALLALVPVAARAEDETFFELKVRPVLAERCFSCHGGKKVSRGLRVDTRAALLQGGKSGPAVVPGNPAASLLMQAVRHEHADLRMPPDARLSEVVVNDLAAWIQRGAPWPQSRAAEPWKGQQHWAFAPVRPVPVPEAGAAWAAHPVDRFVYEQLQAHGLRPAPPADKRTLLRRLSFDLVGLPPTPDEVDTFLADESPDAYEKVVDRLLASPPYGERWGRHWLDVVRYADTAGDNADYPIPEARLYRDYVLDAFNADKPYDQFVREQLAGDLLARQGPAGRYAEQVVATGFLALSRRYATAPYELWHLTLEDTVDTVGQAFLGLTLRCARCHDHKFDPVTQEDYYALYGIFASTQYPWAGAEEFVSYRKPREHFVPLVPPNEAAPRLAQYRQQVQQLVDESRRAEQLFEVGPHPAEGPSSEKAMRGRLDQLRAEFRRLGRPGLPADLPGAYAVQDGAAADCPLQLRGDPGQPGPVVKRGVPKFLAAGYAFQPPPGGSGRLQLAEWLTRPEHPLTARVLVNRLWLHHFGKGLVPTPNNFGLRGEAPTHPALLDWLARRFVEGGWSIKAVQRLLLTSRTYQLASGADDENAARDPANRWYGRCDRRRLDAEALRDALLCVSGELDPRRPGPHPFPKMESWGWTQHHPFKDVYPSRHRSVYLMTQRFQRHPFLGLFDGPDTNTTTGQRRASTVPLQALYLMNNAFVQEQAAAFARRMLAASPDPRQRLVWAHLRAWSRPAGDDEIARGLHYLDECRQHAADELQAWTSYARVLLCANEFIYLD